jgi:hypothetical protein
MKLLGMFLIVGVLGYVLTIWLLREDFEFLAGLMFPFFFMFMCGFFYLIRNSKSMSPLQELWRMFIKGCYDFVGYPVLEIMTDVERGRL